MRDGIKPVIGAAAILKLDKSHRKSFEKRIASGHTGGLEIFQVFHTDDLIFVVFPNADSEIYAINIPDFVEQVNAIRHKKKKT